jgi:hypothetical protein
MPSNPSPATLYMSFDVGQISNQLLWRFEPDLEPATGPGSGAINFQRLQSLSLNIQGSAPVGSGFCGFKVEECVVLTRPQIVKLAPKEPPAFALPSPFKGRKVACTVLQLNTPAVAAAPAASQQGTIIYTQSYSDVLEVDDKTGRWELSFYLTVTPQYTGGDGTDAISGPTRVYVFDPESEVGDGGHPSL